MLQLLQTAVEELAADYLFSEKELEDLVPKIKDTVTAKWLRSMYQAGALTKSDIERQAFAYSAFDNICLEIAKKRDRILPPSSEIIQPTIDELADDVLKLEDQSGDSFPNSLGEPQDGGG
jgi:hypothetical protein